MALTPISAQNINTNVTPIQEDQQRREVEQSIQPNQTNASETTNENLNASTQSVASNQENARLENDTRSLEARTPETQERTNNQQVSADETLGSQIDIRA